MANFIYKIELVLGKTRYLKFRKYHNLFVFFCTSAEYLHKFKFLISQGSVATCQRWGGYCRMGFVENFICFPVVQKFWKSFKIWQSYRDFKSGNLEKHWLLRNLIDWLIDWLIDCLVWTAVDSNMSLLGLFLHVVGASMVRHQISQYVLSDTDRCPWWSHLLPLMTSAVLRLLYPLCWSLYCVSSH